MAKKIIIGFLLSFLLSNMIMLRSQNEFFNGSKGYGFIKEEGVEKDHFVHASGLIDRIDENDKVEFELEEGPKGMSAINVKKID